jgi:hypothetical protein
VGVNDSTCLLVLNTKNKKIKMKNFISLVLICLTFATLGFAQKSDKSKSFYSFNGKTGDVVMTWDEFAKIKKELVSTDSDVKIKSFTVSMLFIAQGSKDSLFMEQPNVGNSFDAKTIEVLEKLRSDDKRPVKKVLIENVKIIQKGAELKAPGMTITLK